MKMVKYRKRCFDQIEGIVAENKAMTMEVDRLRSEAEEKAAEKAAQEERLLDLNRRLADKDWEKKGKSCVPSSFVFNCVVGFVDQRLFLQIWRRKLIASEEKGSGLTRSVPVH
jgi:hypothetical protein